MKGIVYFAIIYIVNSIQITSTVSVTAIPVNKAYPKPSYKPSVKFSATASSQASSQASSKPSISVSSKVSGSSTAYPSASPNTTLYKIKLTENEKIIAIENKKAENKKIQHIKKIDVNPEIKINEQEKSKISYKFITILCAFIVMVFGYGIYKCIYIIKNTKPKKVENGLPFYNNKYIDMNDNNIYHLQPHSPKNQEQCYRRISSNSSISNMESF